VLAAWLRGCGWVNVCVRTCVGVWALADIKVQLRFRSSAARDYRLSFDRKNLHYRVLRKSDSVLQDFAPLFSPDPTYRGSKVVYCATIQETLDIARKLNSQNITSAPYNSRVPLAERRVR
jgi:superfamily II DNA helicase RecQ